MRTSTMRGALLAAALLLAAPVRAQVGGDQNAQKVFKGYALSELDASGLAYNQKAKAAWQRALGPLAKERWLARLDGPSPQNRAVRVAGRDYVLLASSKAHDCEQNNVVLLWAGPNDLIYGKVFQRGRSSYLGAPPADVAAELDKLWKTEWRSTPK
jgi:hypothetical protein